MAKRLIIGLVGNPGSGKSSLAHYLAVQHGFYHFEGSAGIAEMAAERGIELSGRKMFSDFHREMQIEYGHSILADKLLARPEDRLVFAGLRSVHNARCLQKAGGLVVALMCPVGIRFERVENSGLKYASNLEDFKADEEREFFSSDGYGSDPGHVIEIADRFLNTAKPSKETQAELDIIVEELKAA